MMKMPETPVGWASKITGFLNQVYPVGLSERFPVNVAEVAGHLSRQYFPSEAITLIDSKEFDNLEGMLVPNPNGNGEWGIIYNSAIKSKGRINFTVAHEFGHYLLHRHKNPEGIRCESRDMYKWDSPEAIMESEANTFASHLLMPLDDFRAQLANKAVNMDLLCKMADRYGVSVSAAILKWISFTNKRAMIVVARDGFIDWAWSSKALIKSGVYYKARQEVIELPKGSLAQKRDKLVNNKEGILHPPGVWVGDDSVKEMTILTDDYNDMSISLLLYPSRVNVDFDADEPEVVDVFDRFRDR